MADELKDICDKIKQLVPPAIPEDMTGPFEVFMNDISSRIDEGDREAIHRAYNYFNRMLGAQLKGSVPLDSQAQPKKSVQSGPGGSPDKKLVRKDLSGQEDQSDLSSQEDQSDVDSQAKRQQVEDPLQRDNPKQEPHESTKDEEMVSILVKVADSTLN